MMKMINDTEEGIDGNTFILKKKCEMCGNPLKLYQSQRYESHYKFVFINIAQTPSKHFFCSKKCKNEWIFNPGNR